MANRRIIDLHSEIALRNLCEVDREKLMINVGAGKLVDNCRAEKIKLSSSLLKLKVNSLEKKIKKFYPTFPIEQGEEYRVRDSKGMYHLVKPEVVRCFKSIVMSCVESPEVLEEVIRQVLLVIDTKLCYNDYSDSKEDYENGIELGVIIPSVEYLGSRYPTLYKYVEKVIFELLEEVGLYIGREVKKTN